MNKILFATNNISKINRFKDKLLESGYEIISLKDIDNVIEVEETGDNAIDNALIKARAYSSIVDIPVMAMDDNLFLENVPPKYQPGVNVRRVDGKRLNDEEMIKYYTSLVDKYGTEGLLESKWIYGIAVINNRNEYTYTFSKNSFYLTNKVSDKRNEGYPLNSISINKKLNKYFIDMTTEDKININENEDDVIEFIINSIKNKVK